MKVAVVGMGYVGLSNAVLLASQHDVIVLDILPEKVAQLNRRHSPIHDVEIEAALAERTLQLRATLDAHEALVGADGFLVRGLRLGAVHQAVVLGVCGRGCKGGGEDDEGQDLPPLDDVRWALDLGPAVPLVVVDARDRLSALDALLVLLYHNLDTAEARMARSESVHRSRLIRPPAPWEPAR